MSIEFLRDKKRYRFYFEATIKGKRIRASKLLPRGWNKAQADTYDKNESARLFAEATGVQRPTATIEEAVGLYIREKCPGLKNGTGAAHELDRCYEAYAGRMIEELPEVAAEYIKKESGRLSPATIRNRLAYLRAACRYAFRRHQLCEHDPAERMEMPRVKNERHYYASRREMLTIAAAMSNPQARAVLRVAFYSGMRLGEILRAQVLDGKAFLLTDTKNGDRRIVPAHPKILSCLKRFPITVAKITVQRQFMNAARRLGLGHFHFHDMRHSAASEMINSGVNLYSVGAVLGHRSAQSTKRYSHLATDTLADAIAVIGRKSRTAA
jgi:integrase